jgi:ribosomal protein S18 acetylase RimI-like enzyme
VQEGFAMNGDIKISIATVDDSPEILRLQKNAFMSEAELYNDFNIDPLTQTLDSLQKDFKNYLFLKAERGNEIVGCVKARETGEFCWIGRLMVTPEFQNQGIGKYLMTEIEKAFPKTKLYLLCTGYKSCTNINLYESLGYNRKELLNDERNHELILVKMIKGNTVS